MTPRPSFTKIDVILAAGDVLNHDIDPTDGIYEWMVEHYPGATERFITAVEQDAYRQRDLCRMHGLFEYIDGKLPASADDEAFAALAAEIEEDVAHELKRQSAALPLIEYAAWRTTEEAMRDAAEEYAQGEDEV